LDAAAIARTFQIKENPLFLFIGQFENEEFQNQFQTKANQPEIANDILIVGQQKNINEWMAAGDLLILPSYEGTEGMGRVLFEAMACALPVIGTNISGINEAVTKDTGLLINEHSPEEIAKAIQSILYSNEVYINFSMNARRHAQEVFDIKIHAQKVMEFYKDLTG
jgi:glycosyltransferase involved in cell wall biosynthesis